MAIIGARSKTDHLWKPARDGLKRNAFVQNQRVIVNVHREQARAYRLSSFPPTSHETAMTISLYDASVPVFKQMLSALSDVLKKAEAHATEKNIDPNAFLQARLYPDMFPLVRQVQIAVDFAKGVSSRLAEVEVPKYEDTETTFAELQALLTKVLAYIGEIKPEQINGKEGIEIVTRPGTPKEKRFSGQAYLLSYGLPQFFFHVTTAYALLRHNGVEVGKRDYMGAF